MVIKVLKLAILRELTEEEEESYKGGTPTEGTDIPVSGVPKIKNATGEPPISHVNLVPKPPVVSKPLVGSPEIETT
ncbi:hypothetical protein NIES4072_13220 [Nostoc commune NIES-4072]|uniref:Uncharacterized protein n=1 Tax=Nostoc commune NIES-4072 TaxID=2005467 RepID=A0A2R5FPD7_NOSCO|nr:hypothetical protein [Nostoc commune]BBD65014.1 hypothetical protein NIES4070_13600 [Nostoc commune HK-02]GBG17661.1 hypothetical protein NIES4072_13220 [Nostoc commune NIES-4072]